MLGAGLLIVLFSVASVSCQQADELDLITQRRKSDLATFPTDASFARISTWLGSQRNDGTWPDVNYLAGCDAQRANWPIQEHWTRLITFASAWSGLNPNAPSNWTRSESLLNATKKGMDWWFANDYASDDCIGGGGKSNGTCPCGTPGLWNTNWFGQVILIPQLVSTTCLLISDSGLSSSEQSGCFRIPNRAYVRRDSFIDGVGYLTGANTINVMQNSVSMALYIDNATILSDAIDRAMAAVTFSDQPAEDGIHRDGSFLQHDGILYNGNYGKDLLNAFIQLEGEAIGTSLAANYSTRQAFATDIRGSEWMIYADQRTKQERWDLNVLGRFIAFPVVDLQANSDISFNVTKLAAATADFNGENDVSDVVRRLSSNGTERLLGNAPFWASDYMVHRRDNFIIGNKMISNRSHNTEYTNSANPYGNHLGQGTLFSYVTGREYLDIEAGWDWNLIPGTTVLLEHPRLNSSGTNVGVTGKKSYVGVVSDGWVGTSVMDYIDPLDGSLAYRKAWFFLDDSVVMMTTAISVNSSVPTASDRPVITVLDNRASVGSEAMIDGNSVNISNSTKVNATTLYYGGNGYLSYGSPFALTLSEGNRTGNWSAISTSRVGQTSVPIFSAFTTLQAGTTSAYAFFPDTSADVLDQERHRPSTTTLATNGTLAVAGFERLSVAFWPGSARSLSVNLNIIGWASSGVLTVTSQQPAIYLFATKRDDQGKRTAVITFSDPSQSLKVLSFSLNTAEAMKVNCTTVDWDDGCRQNGSEVNFTVSLPQGGWAGSSSFREVLLA